MRAIWNTRRHKTICFSITCKVSPLATVRDSSHKCNDHAWVKPGYKMFQNMASWGRQGKGSGVAEAMTSRIIIIITSKTFAEVRFHCFCTILCMLNADWSLTTGPLDHADLQARMKPGYKMSNIFRAEKRSAQASAHFLSQAQGGLFGVLTVFVCCWSSEWNARGANVCSL